jgi:hypothetical protein
MRYWSISLRGVRQKNHFDKKEAPAKRAGASFTSRL